MLVKQEKVAYTIANASVRNTLVELDDGTFFVCHVCAGAGLLAHPTEYMQIAYCYMCNGTGLIPVTITPKDVCGCGNVANAKTVPIRS